MKVLIGCEFSGIVRDAFLAKGHDAWSCDLLPSERPGNHIQEDIFKVAGRSKWAARRTIWDLMIFHWPCTNLASSGARWFKQKRERQVFDIMAFESLMEDCPIPHIAGENPIGVLSTYYRKPDQIIQPWQFGHGETKATCLWLKNLPKLVPTDIVEGRDARVHRMPPGPDRWKERSRTFAGIATACADQWASTAMESLT